jgi:hypothetical protein
LDFFFDLSSFFNAAPISSDLVSLFIVITIIALLITVYNKNIKCIS